MNFGPDTTNNTLQGYTRFLLGDPTSAASQQWPLQEIKDALNQEYLLVREMGRQKGSGVALKRTYASLVQDQIHYQVPADFVELRSVEVSNNGSDLSTAAVADAEIIYPEINLAEKALLAYNAQVVTTFGQRAFVQDDHIGIVAPPGASQVGTNTIRMVYEASTVELSADGDEPDVPRPHQPLIAYRAAIVLKLARDQNVSDLAAMVRERQALYELAIQPQAAMEREQISASGMIRKRARFRFGKAQRPV